jgi:hypothetical protein
LRLLGSTKNKKKFRPGEQVRIASLGKIKKTLDRKDQLEGLLFMESMAEFCGGEYEVLREVKWFFDEANKKMRKCKGILVLKDLVCRGKGILDGEDCSRCCPYLWNTIWLEKV